MTYQLITTNTELNNACQFFSTLEHIAVDTEFKRETSYYPKPCLIQIAGGDKTVCIDPFDITDFSSLKQLLCGDDTLKIFHAGRQDMEVFQQIINCIPEPVFDTQIAAALLGFPNQIGYSTLVNELLQIELDKSLTRTDWEKRPLSEDELEYAANDVIYLEKIFKIQHEQLDKKQRLDWLYEEIDTIFHEDSYSDSLEKVWKKISRSAKFQEEQQKILYALNQWRENEAQTRDRARQFIISNEILTSIALNQPRNLNELKQINNIPGPVINRYSDELLKLVNGESTQELIIPDDNTYFRLSPEEQALLKQIKGEVQQTAKTLNIDDTFICNKKTMEKLVRGNKNTRLFTGWRYEVIGKKLEQLVSKQV